MRFNLNVSSANIATAGPKMEIGASVQESDCTRVVVPTIVGGWRTLCPFALVAVGVVVLTSLAVFAAWRMYKHHKRTRDLEEEEPPLRELEESDFEESNFEESESEESDVDEAVSESEESDVDEAESDESDFEESESEESDVDEAESDESDFEESDFEESESEESDVDEAESDESDVEESESEESDVEESDYEESDFDESEFDEPESEESNFEESDFEEPEFDEPESEESNFEESDFEEPNFVESAVEFEEMCQEHQELLVAEVLKENTLLRTQIREAINMNGSMFTIVKEKEEQLREATNIAERMIAIVKEKDDMVRNLMILYDNLKKEKDFQIHDLMAEQEKLKNDHRILEEKLEDALSKREKELEEAHNSIQDMERLLKEEGKEKRELTNLYNEMVENKDHQIRDILAKEDKLNAAKELSQEKLDELANRMQDLESLLKEKEEEKTEMTSLYDKIIATREQQIEDLLAKEDKLKEEQETLQEKLGKALSCLKEEQDFKIEIERRWLLEMREKNRELDMLRKLCEEYDERQRNLEEKLGEDLNEMQKLGLSLKKAEDSLTETCWLVKEKEEALVKVRSRCEEQDTELERLRQQGIDLQGKLQKKEVDYESLSVQRNELETLLNTKKELLREREREISDLKMRYQQILTEKEQQEKSLLEENDCLQKEVASLQLPVVAMSNEEKLKGEFEISRGKSPKFPDG
ncbi:golgin subfamily A member 6-like protein 22 [Macrobrachium nipponense]|uniref:golgin subfamily A member 6-like protein 22 n=1 Tax=Macrobrachium nipponense TaxID=159736 RepID=UPI0030C7B484